MTRLVLVGGGHAHLHVLADLAARPLPGVEVTLVSPSPWHHYSGMVPGFLQGTYEAAELTIDLAALAACAGARLVEAAAERIEVARRRVVTGDGPLPFDVLSLDIGADAAGLDVPGVRAHALPVRPMQRALGLRTRIDALATPTQRASVRVIVVGAGAGGVEVAFALHRRIRDRGVRPEVSLVEAAADVLPDYAEPVRRRAAGILARRGIAVRLGSAVIRVEEGAVQLASGTQVPADLIVWLSGATGPGLLAEAGLALDSRGFLLVGPTLQAVDGTPVWAAGDCATLAAHRETPKAGVYAVRQGPVLAQNLRAAVTGGPAAPYVPQRTFLSLLNTADGKALLRWHAVVSHSRGAWWLKDRIDRRFVRGYQASPGAR